MPSKQPNRPDKPLSPRQRQVWKLRKQHPDWTLAQIGFELGMKPVTVASTLRNARLRLGVNAVESMEEVKRARAELLDISRKGLARKFHAIADRVVDELRDMPDETFRDLVHTKPKDMMLVAAISVDKGDKLEERPDRVVELRDHRKLDEVARLLMEEAKRRGEIIDVTPGMHTSSDQLIESELSVE